MKHELWQMRSQGSGAIVNCSSLGRPAMDTTRTVTFFTALIDHLMNQPRQMYVHKHLRETLSVFRRAHGRMASPAEIFAAHSATSAPNRGDRRLELWALIRTQHYREP
jgi:hypothetical protein